MKSLLLIVIVIVVTSTIVPTATVAWQDKEKAAQPANSAVIKKTAAEFFKKASQKDAGQPPNSQSTESPSPKPSPQIDNGKIKANPNEKPNDSLEIGTIPEPPAILLDPLTQEKYMAALREYYEYRIAGFRHRNRVFQWQLISSIIIFFIVIALVVVGMYFSWVQFRDSLKRDKARKTNGGELAVLSQERTELEASLSGIKISSPILGVIILIVSLLFFYLYLVHVYPISEIF